MNRGTNKFYATCWKELVRLLIETIAEDEAGEYPAAQDMLTLMGKVEKKVGEEG